MRTKGSKNKIPALEHVNIRLPVEVINFFKNNQKKQGYTIAMREALEKVAGYVKPK